MKMTVPSALPHVLPLRRIHEYDGALFPSAHILLHMEFMWAMVLERYSPTPLSSCFLRKMESTWMVLRPAPRHISGIEGP
jgi:hypothetical protein